MNDNPEISILSDNVDKSQVPPIEQKRMVAFINEFIISTVSFLNEFMAKCEVKFVEFEQKMQRIEASLLIVEAKMASIPDVDLKPSSSTTTAATPSSSSSSSSSSNDPTEAAAVKTEMPIETKSQTLTEQNVGDQERLAIPSTSQANESDRQVSSTGPDEHDNNTSSGVKACDDIKYRKYFKMLQFGVPAPAVKLKMTNEGHDPNILDNPNRILEDGEAYVATDE